MSRTHLRDFSSRSRVLLRKAIILAVLLSLFVYPAQLAQAAAGDLVPGFGIGGIVNDDPTPLVTGQKYFEDSVQKLVVQPDGKIVAGGFSIYDTSNSGDFQIARYNADGSLDTSFGSGGHANTGLTVGPAATNRLGLSDIALETDGSGKIVAVGDNATYIVPPAPDPPSFISNTFAIVRFNANGALDTTFNTTGVAIMPTTSLLGGLAFPCAVAIQGDGKIVVGGYYATDNRQHKFALVRFNTNGSLDASFGNNGIVSATPGLFDDEIHSLLIDANQKIVVAGHSQNVTATGAKGAYRFAVARYNTNGSLDTGFGSGGYALTPIGGASNQARSVALQPDGKLVVAGSAPVPPIPGIPQPTSLSSMFTVARYNSDGSLDTTFNSTGTNQFNFDVTVHADYAFSTTVDSYGRIVVGGFTYQNLTPTPALYTGGTEEMAVARLCPDGQLDTPGHCSTAGFGSGTGRVAFPVGPYDSANNNWRNNIFSLAIRPSDGNILAGGFSRGTIHTSAGKKWFTTMLFDSGGAATYTISGNVSDGINPIAGAVISYNNGGPQTTTTDSLGNYAFTVPSNWTGTVVPTCSSPACPSPVTFFPGGRTYANLRFNQTGQNYNTSGVYLPVVNR